MKGSKDKDNEKHCLICMHEVGLNDETLYEVNYCCKHYAHEQCINTMFAQDAIPKCQICGKGIDNKRLTYGITEVKNYYFTINIIMIPMTILLALINFWNSQDTKFFFLNLLASTASFLGALSTITVVSHYERDVLMDSGNPNTPIWRTTRFGGGYVLWGDCPAWIFNIKKNLFCNMIYVSFWVLPSFVHIGYFLIWIWYGFNIKYFKWTLFKLMLIFYTPGLYFILGHPIIYGFWSLLQCCFKTKYRKYQLKESQYVKKV